MLDLASQPPLLFKLKVVLEDSRRNHSMNWNNGFMEQGDQERSQGVCLDKSPDLANFSERSIYSFGKLWGTLNTQVGGILALRGRGNKAFPPGLDSREPGTGFLSPSWPQRRHLASLCLCFFLCLVKFILPYLTHRAHNDNSHHLLRTYRVWGTGLSVISFS